MPHHVLTVSQRPGGARDVKNETLKLDLIALPLIPTFIFAPISTFILLARLLDTGNPDSISRSQ